MGYPAREPLDVNMFFYHRGTWVISKLAFRNYLQWSYPKRYIRVDHVELTIVSNKKSLCKQCLFQKSNLKSLSRLLTLQWFMKCLMITLHLLLAPSKRQLSFFLYFSFLRAHISSLGFHPAPLQLFHLWRVSPKGILIPNWRGCEPMGCKVQWTLISTLLFLWLKVLLERPTICHTRPLCS